MIRCQTTLTYFSSYSAVLHLHMDSADQPQVQLERFPAQPSNDTGGHACIRLD